MDNISLIPHPEDLMVAMTTMTMTMKEVATAVLVELL
jgi:hypothetical protein